MLSKLCKGRTGKRVSKCVLNADVSDKVNDDEAGGYFNKPDRCTRRMEEESNEQARARESVTGGSDADSAKGDRTIPSPRYVQWYGQIMF